MSAKPGKIDWEKVRAQLARSGEALEKALEEDPVQAAEIFRQRARSLALRRREPATGSHSSGWQIQTFKMGEQQYGIGLDALVRVLPFASCARVPGAAPEVLGLINFQGNIRVVFELRLLLGLAAGAESTAGYLLLLKNRGQPVGLRVEELGPVRDVLPEELGENSGWTRLAGDCEKGITRDRLVILDEEKIGQKIRSDHRTNE